MLCIVTHENPTFRKMIDDLLLIDADKDPELAEGFRWIDEQAKKRGVSIYEFTYYVLEKGDAVNRAKEWLASRSRT